MNDVAVGLCQAWSMNDVDVGLCQAWLMNDVAVGLCQAWLMNMWMLTNVKCSWWQMWMLTVASMQDWWMMWRTLMDAMHIYLCVKNPSSGTYLYGLLRPGPLQQAMKLEWNRHLPDNRMKPGTPVKNQQTRELISAWKTSQEHSNKDLSHLRSFLVLPGMQLNTPSKVSDSGLCCCVQVIYSEGWLQLPCLLKQFYVRT